MLTSQLPRIDFFCIGAPKTASTWLAECMSEHPDVLVPRVKEPNYFVKTIGLQRRENPDYLRDAAWYASLFEGPDSKLRGDYSVNLLHNVETAPHVLRKQYPDAKLIVMLREPVSRAYSQYWYYKRNNPYLKLPPFEEMLETPEFLGQCLYDRQLEAWHAEFPQSSFHYVLDSEIKADALAAVQGVYRFLGVDATHEPTQLKRRVNAAKEKAGWFKVLGAARRGASSLGLRRVTRAVATSRAGRWVARMGTRESAYPPMSPETRARIAPRFAEDTAKLSKRIGRDLSAWRER